MKRLWIILVAGVIIELSRGYFTPRLEALPAKPDGWTLVTQTARDPVPAELKTSPVTSRAVKAWRGTYSGRSLMTTTLYAMPWSPGSAWDAIQRWRPAPGTMALRKAGTSEWQCRRVPIRPRCDASYKTSRRRFRRGL